MVAIMDYIFKKYYKKENYKESYKARVNFEASLKLDFFVNDYPLYFVFNSYTTNLMDRVRVLDKEIEALYGKLPEVAKFSFLDDIIVEEIHSSNEIEGVRSTKEDLLFTKRKLEENKDSKLRFSSIIKSYSNLSDNDRVDSIKDIRNFYDRLLGDELSSKSQPDTDLFRQGEVFVQSNKSFDGSYIHRGIDSKLLNSHMEKWIGFMNDKDLHILLRVAIGHYLFEYMHPFYDGNGRVGRFLSSMYIRHSYSYLTSLAVSRGAYIKKNDYYKSFRQTNEKINMGELNYFVDEFVKIIIKAQEDMRDLLRLNTFKLDKTLDWLEDKFSGKEEIINILFVLMQDYIFSVAKGISREYLLEGLKITGFSNYSHNLRCFEELEEDGYIAKSKHRPIVYRLTDDLISFVEEKIL